MATRIHLNDQFSLKVAPIVRYLPRCRLPAVAHRTQSTLPCPSDRSPSQRPAATESSFDSRREGTAISLAERCHSRSRPVRTQEGARRTEVETSSPQRRRRIPNSLVISNGYLSFASVCEPITTKECSLSPIKVPRPRYCRLRCRNKKPETAIPEDKPLADVKLVPITFREGMADAPGKMKWEETARVLWRRRTVCRAYPVLILNFEGVVGDYMKSAPWTYAQDFYLRPGFDRSLLDLLTKFQVVLMTALPKVHRNTLLDILEKRHGIVFDAVYKKRKTDGTSFVLDYSQVLLDFSIDSGLEAVLIITSVGIDQEDLAVREGPELIKDDSVSSRRRFLW